MPSSNSTEHTGERFRASFEQALLPLWLMDLQGRYLEVNQALAQLLGQSREALLGASHLDFVHPDERDLDAEGLRLMSGGARHASHRDTRMLRSDGSTLWVSVAVAPARDAGDHLTHLVGQGIDVTARRQHEEQLRHLADHDPLTGLLNRRGFDRELRRHVSRIDRYGAEGALLMLDLDEFKSYNDSHGHAGGDELLRRVAGVLSGRLRSGDVVGRIGGDEFAVLLPKANPAQAETVADALVKTIANAEHNGHRITASVGVFSFSGDQSASEDTAMVGADAAMYSAKSAGRNGYAPFGGRDGDRTPDAADEPLLAGEPVANVPAV